ncbi:MAG: hypothetical protein KAJ51_02180, partial [Thermoplasmata archaeon]|nr:hypothetical protein [Thermoplasmata archaeon]
DTTYKTIEVELNKAAITALNKKLSSSPKYYTFGVGMFVKNLQTGRNSGYADWHDIRLELTFEFKDDMQPTEKGEGIAFGDDWSGHVYEFGSASDYPYGYIYTDKQSKSEYRGYSNWDISKIANVFPVENFSIVEIKKVSVRFNHYSGNPSGYSIWQMKYNASDASVSDDTLFIDCGDGTKYYNHASGTSVSDTEFEWDLGKDAVKDFQDAFEDNNPTFFGLGWTKSSNIYSYDFSPKLVIEWTITPIVIVSLTDETPEGYEASPVYFDASTSKNVSGGSGALRFEWDWDAPGTPGYGIYDKVSTSPLAEYTWPDDYEDNITLRVNDTETGTNESREFTVVVHNVHPLVNTTKGSIDPQPVYEAENVTFKGFEVIDPAGKNDKYWYFWDFDGDGDYDKNGSCIDFTVPEEVWYYDDDFQGDASLLVMDEDGGSTNLTFPKHYDAMPPTTFGTGYVHSSSQLYLVWFGKPTVEWQYSDDRRRGWAKFDLSGMEPGAIVDKVVFEGRISQDINVDLVGVRYMDIDPVPSVLGNDKDVWDAAGDGPKIFDITWKIGSVKEDLTDFVKSPAGQEILKELMSTGSVVFSFNYEKPDPSFERNQGYLNGYTYGEPVLSIDYHLEAPRYLFPIVVKNLAPEINCSSIIVAPTTINEGDNITVTNLSFCDKGNDTYEYNISVG